MKTLYLTKAGGTTDLTDYYTKAQTDALTWTESDITDLDKYTQAAADAAFAPITRPRRNLIINGAFNVWQRGSSFAGLSGTNLTWTADRFRWTASTDATVTVSQLQPTTAGIPFDHALQVDVTTADASIGATQYAGFIYFVEGIDCRHLRQGYANAATVTLSFWHLHSKTGTHSGSFRNSANDRSYTFEYTQDVAGVWQQSAVTVDLDTTGTWLESVETGLKIHFAAAVGSNLQTAAGSWTAGSYLGTSNQVNNLDNTSNWFRIANVKLEVGSEATDFGSESQTEALLKCMRYYLDFPPGHDSWAYGNIQSSTLAYVSVPIPVPMRATPSLVYTVGDHRIRGGANLTPSSITANRASKNTVELSAVITGGTQYNACSIRDTGSNTLALDAELS